LGWTCGDVNIEAEATLAGEVCEVAHAICLSRCTRCLIDHHIHSPAVKIAPCEVSLQGLHCGLLGVRISVVEVLSVLELDLLAVTIHHLDHSEDGRARPPAAGGRSNAASDARWVLDRSATRVELPSSVGLNDLEKILLRERRG